MVGVLAEIADAANQATPAHQHTPAPSMNQPCIFHEPASYSFPHKAWTPTQQGLPACHGLRARVQSVPFIWHLNNILWLRIFQSYLNIFPFNLKWFFLWIVSSVRAGRVCYLFTTWGLSAWKWTAGAQNCCSVLKLSLTLCDPMDCRMPAFLVLQCLLELAQTHVHWVDDVIQPPHSLSPPSHPVLNLSQHQGLFQWVGSLHQVQRGPKCWTFNISPSNEYSG